ncbi:hypothetical protein CHS0354_007331 [Potamilus streckersoni]|uniref:Pseudouridylate synthase 7 homolog n=1 Tax=Potamilus streckersoni TaxID=2493646 RepID=A0AAE0TFM9_9BIVA|nr:hypothetical protein CHS0354_007331 [Potamilus streckersoni]
MRKLYPDIVTMDSPPIAKKPRHDDYSPEKPGLACSEWKTTDVEEEKIDENMAAKPKHEVMTEAEVDRKMEPDADKEVDSRPESLLREGDVGITEYICSHQGFHGILKQRYSDFIVNEIDLDGNVVHLTSTDIAIEMRPPSQVKDVCDILSDDQIDLLHKLMSSKDKKRQQPVLIEVGEDKEFRTRIHHCIRKDFPGLESTTVSENGKKVIKVVNAERSSRTERWPADRGNYCRFVLYKENKDTMDTVNLIARLARVKPSLFQYAGTKDRRAKTSQEVTVYKMIAEKLRSLNSSLRNIVLGNFRYVNQPLKLGQLSGNHFTIVLRCVTGEDKEIKKVMTSLQEIGFINYYGMQRFGTTSIPTYHIGRCLLHSDWKEAVELILKPRPHEDEEVSKARKIWWETKDAREALKYLPQRCNIERTLLQALQDHEGRDYFGVFSRLTRNTRLMYIHSYQSYIWNRIASRRLHTFGHKLVAGDLVLRGCDTKAADVEMLGHERQIPEIITDSNISQFDIHDVVLPLPGYDVVYPQNEVCDWYREALAHDNLDIENMRHKIKDYSLSGAYRKLVVKPKDFKWQTMYYDDVNVPLAYGDWDQHKNESQPESVAGGKHKALILEMSLPPSCYATMAVREILKTDTSAGHQSSLNVT